MILEIGGAVFGVGLFLWLRWRAKKLSLFKELGIPGPKPNLIFGNLLEMFRKNPLVAQNDWIRQYGDVFGYYYGTHPCLVVSNPEHLKEVLVKNFAVFPDRPIDLFALDGDRPDQPISQHVINMRGRRWRHVRKLISPCFSSFKIKTWSPLLESSISLMMEKLEEESKSENVDIYPFLKRMTLDAIAQVAFGMDSSVQDQTDHVLNRTARLIIRGAKFKSPLNLLFASFREFNLILEWIRFLLLLIFNNGKNPLDEMYNLSGQVIQRRKQNPTLRRPDLLQGLIDSESSHDVTEPDSDDGNDGKHNRVQKLSEIEIRANTSLFFMAGYETTSTALAFVVFQLVRQQEIQEKVRQEILENLSQEEQIDHSLLNNLLFTERVILESIRINPPVHFFVSRLSVKEFQLGRFSIPAGMPIQIPVYHLHHNPAHFPQPHIFDPNRFLPEKRSNNTSMVFQGFGAGPRQCLGISFAMAAIKITLIRLLRKYRLVLCSKSEKGPIEMEIYIGFLNPKNGIYVKMIPLQ